MSDFSQTFASFNGTLCPPSSNCLDSINPVFILDVFRGALRLQLSNYHNGLVDPLPDATLEGITTSNVTVGPFFVRTWQSSPPYSPVVFAPGSGKIQVPLMFQGVVTDECISLRTPNLNIVDPVTGATWMAAYQLSAHIMSASPPPRDQEALT